LLNNSKRRDKKGSTKPDYIGPLASGLNRRAFLKTSMAISLLAGLPGCKPQKTETEQSKQYISSKNNKQTFSQSQLNVLDAVQMQLFPDDGNGPSARDINATKYLEWAMSDQQNIEDGDPEFIANGVGWLNDLATQTQGDSFVDLDTIKQDKVLRQIATSNAGENWLSMLMYYLTEALLLDPVYGGNTNSSGWNWLEHQAGFPAPVLGKTYRDFK
jgi:gluconate 2-dehydrogenase gamma chain